jgi:hypothetical protein
MESTAATGSVAEVDNAPPLGSSIPLSEFVPTKIAPPSCDVLSQEQAHSWREKGFCVVDPQVGGTPANPLGWIFTEQEVHRYRTAARTAVLGNGVDVQALPDMKNFGGVGFPFLARKSDALNELTLHSRIIRAVRQLLEISSTDVPILSQAECWVKRDAEPSPDLPAEFVNTDQRMHCDYPNHYLTHPPTWYNPEAVAMIVYLDDCVDCGGETAFVPREGEDDDAYRYPYINMPGVADMPWINDKTHAERYLSNHFPEVHSFREKLYAREQKVHYKIGTILIYRLDLWHRGTPLNKDKDRAVVNLLFKKSDAKHITSWHRGWAVS